MQEESDSDTVSSTSSRTRKSGKSSRSRKGKSDAGGADKKEASLGRFTGSLTKLGADAPYVRHPIRVVARFRPATETEKTLGKSVSNIEWDYPDPYTLVMLNPGQQDAGARFSFDRVLSPTSTQEETFNVLGKDVVERSLAGFHCAILAWGETGAGKSYSMFGPDFTQRNLKGSVSTMHRRALQGIVPRVARYLFDCIVKQTDGTQHTLSVSMFTVHRESVIDLLATEAATKLSVSRDRMKGVWLDGICSEYVASPEDVYTLLREGEDRVMVGRGQGADASASMHTLFQLRISQRLQDGSLREGSITLGDLAGSELCQMSTASGTDAVDARQVANGSMAMEACIQALASLNVRPGSSTNDLNTLRGGTGTVPHRNSVLTSVLRDALGGNCETTFLLNCSPHPSRFAVTMQTLRFGQLARDGVCSIRCNQAPSLAQQERTVDTLRSELRKAISYCGALEEHVRQVKGPDWQLEGAAVEAFGTVSPGMAHAQAAELVAMVAHVRAEADEHIRLLKQEVHRLAEEAAQKSMRLAHLEGEASELRRAETMKAVYTATDMEAREQRWRFRLQDREAELDVLQRDLAKRAADSASAKEEVARLHMTLTKVTTDKKKLKTLRRESEVKQQELRAALERERAEASRLKKRLQRVVLENKHIVADQQREDQQVAQLEAKVTTLTKERDELAMKVDLYTLDTGDDYEHVGDTHLRTQLEAAEAKAHEYSVSVMRLNQQLRDTLRDKNAQISELEGEVDKLTNTMQLMRDRHGMVLRAELMAYNKHLSISERFVSEREDLSTQIVKLARELALQRRKNEVQARQVSLMRERVAQLETLLDNKQEEITELRMRAKKADQMMKLQSRERDLGVALDRKYQDLKRRHHNVETTTKGILSRPLLNTYSLQVASVTSSRSLNRKDKRAKEARADVPETVLTDKRGYLRIMRSGRRKWKRHFFVLRRDRVLVYPSQLLADQAGRESGMIRLTHSTKCGKVTPESTGVDWAFGVYHPKLKHVFLAATSYDERQGWMEAIEATARLIPPTADEALQAAVDVAPGQVDSPTGLYSGMDAERRQFKDGYRPPHPPNSSQSVEMPDDMPYPRRTDDDDVMSSSAEPDFDRGRFGAEHLARLALRRKLEATKKRGRRKQEVEDEAKVKCNICGDVISVMDVDAHSLTCTSNLDKDRVARVGVAANKRAVNPDHAKFVARREMEFQALDRQLEADQRKVHREKSRLRAEQLNKKVFASDGADKEDLSHKHAEEARVASKWMA